MLRPALYAVVFFGLAAGAALAQGAADPMEEQRCVWACLANSPGAASRQYNDCVKQYCEGMGAGGTSAPAAAAPGRRASAAPAASIRPAPRPPLAEAAPEVAPVIGTALVVPPAVANARAAEVAAADAPGLPAAPSLPTAPELQREVWTFGPTPDGAGFFAGIRDPARGSRIDWLCGKGRASVLALSPYQGDGALVISVDGRPKEVAMTVEGSMAWAPIALADPLFLHVASGAEVVFADRAGAELGRFPMQGAPAAIGQALGRCQ